MAEDINPITRFFVIAMLVISPILVVIFQRIETVREVIKDIKDGDFSLKSSFRSFSSNDNQHERLPAICPKCFAVNPPDHKFCGYCGAEIPKPTKGEKQ